MILRLLLWSIAAHAKLAELCAVMAGSGLKSVSAKRKSIEQEKHRANKLPSHDKYYSGTYTNLEQFSLLDKLP
jgi:hypothetical protein